MRECCNSFLASFKIWNAATVGGNICMSLPAGPMISLTVALEATYTLWPRTAPAREVPIDRFRDRQSHQRSPTGRTAPQHSLAGIGAVEALRVPSRIAHASRTLGGAVDRHAKRGRRRSRDHDHRGHPSARSSCGSSKHHPQSSCGARSTSVSRPTDISTTSTARPPISATSPAISLSRFAPSWRNPERANETCRRCRLGQCPDELQRQWQIVFRRADPRTMPAHLPARPRRVRRQEGLRRRRLRRLHGVARRHARFTPA